MEEIRWYEKLDYTETKDIIKEKLQNMSRDFVAIGFYLKLIRDKSLFLEDGYAVWNKDVKDKDERLDDGSTDIDSLDAFEYTIERDMRDLIEEVENV